MADGAIRVEANVHASSWQQSAEILQARGSVICNLPELLRSERVVQQRIARRRAEPGWRAAVLDERAKRVRKAAANERQPQRAERAIL